MPERLKIYLGHNWMHSNNSHDNSGHVTLNLLNSMDKNFLVCFSTILLSILQLQPTYNNMHTMLLSASYCRGGTGGGPCPTDDTWFFNDTTNSWVELNRCITPRVWSKMAPLTNNPGKIVLYAGNAMWAKQVVLVSRNFIPIIGLYYALQHNVHNNYMGI